MSTKRQYHDLDPDERAMVLQIDECGEASMSELKQVTGLYNKLVSQRLEKLSEGGWVEYEVRGPPGNQMTYARLTADGKEAVQQAIDHRLEKLDSITENIETHEDWLDQHSHILKDIVSDLDDSEAVPVREQEYMEKHSDD